MFKKMFPLLGTAGLLAASALCTAPVRAESLDSPLLISQLRGHNTYMGEPQMDPARYVLGRVRGTVGGILFVEFMKVYTVDGKELMSTEAVDGYTRRIVGDAKGGDDVIFEVVDDKLVFVGLAHPYWISRLKLKSETAVDTNTSQLLQELNQSPRAWGLPTLAPESRTYTEATPVPEPAPAAAPIRGLW
jgi:hypothetical protein